MAETSGLSSGAAGTSDSVPRPRMRASIPASAGGTICAPSPRYSLYPLSAGGLWLAVIMIPAAAQRWRTAKASSGVGRRAGSMCTRMPAPARTLATSSAKSADRCLASQPTTTPASAAPGTLLPQPPRHGGGRAADDGAVHPVRARRDDAAKPGGPESQPGGEAVGEFRGRCRAPIAEQREQFGPIR